MKQIFILICLMLVQSTLAGATDLGVGGNAAVAQTFAQYVAKPAGCRPLADLRRVMVAGFGPFAGTWTNISGLVVDSMSDPAFWPDEVNTASDAGFGALSEDHRGRNRSRDFGGRSSSRVLTIDGRRLQVCFIVLDVMWDLSPAIVIEEMERFQPELVITTGTGEVRPIFEEGNLNRANGLSGYDFSGNASKENVPRSGTLLPLSEPGVREFLDLSWNPFAASASAQPLIDSLGFQAVVAPGPRSSNTYICNHIAYLVENAARGVRLPLAGGELEMKPALERKDIKTGFFHYPGDSRTRARDIAVWARAVARMMISQLQ